MLTHLPRHDLLIGRDGWRPILGVSNGGAHVSWPDTPTNRGAQVAGARQGTPFSSIAPSDTTAGCAC